jgi:phosphonate transport system permease protein
MRKQKEKDPRIQMAEDIKPGFVPPFVAAIASAIIPGLGQFLSRSFRKGLVLLFSFATILGLLVWRFKLAAPRDNAWKDIIPKAFHLQPLMIWVTVLVGLLYLWIIVDAYFSAKKLGGAVTGVTFYLLVVFFAIGWQIGGIDLVALTTQAGDAVPALSRVLWPWERAITYPKTLLIGKGEVLSPCTDEVFPETTPLEDHPYIVVAPTCGKTSEQSGDEGTTLTLNGFGFAPDTETEIWWKDPIGNEFRQRQGGEYVKVFTDGNGQFVVDVIMPYRLLPPSAGDGPKIWEVQGRQIASVGAGELSSEFKLVIEKMVETIFIGMMATFFGIILALPISFLAARNLMSMSPLTIAIYYLVRTFMNIIRSIEPLIWAIIAVIVVGLGPFAGILALTVHSMAALGKLYSESIESIDPGPIEAVQATGANWLQVVMYAVVPQVIPPFVSFTIYRWDINIRMSTIIGFVGGGGIGFLLAQWIRLLDYAAAGIAVWFIAITVAILDYVSAEIRQRFV